MPQTAYQHILAKPAMLGQRREDRIGGGVDCQAALLGVQPVVNRQPTGLAVFGLLPLPLLLQTVDQPSIDGGPADTTVPQVATRHR